MPLPPMNPDGRLPFANGPWSASLYEVYERFVLEAPHSPHRARIFRGLETWLELAEEILGAGRIWLDGGFVTHKAEAPHDVDLVFLPDDRDRANEALESGEAHPLLTVQDVFFMAPLNGGSLDRMQPVSGLVDAFLVDPDHTEALEYWHGLWSCVKLADGTVPEDVYKGYLEVKL